MTKPNWPPLSGVAGEAAELAPSTSASRGHWTQDAAWPPRLAPAPLRLACSTPLPSTQLSTCQSWQVKST